MKAFLAVALSAALVGCYAQPGAAEGTDEAPADLAGSELEAPKLATGFQWHVIVDPGVPEFEAAEIEHALEAWKAVIPCGFDWTLERAAVGSWDDVLPAGTLAIKMGEPPQGNGAVGQTLRPAPPNFFLEGATIVLQPNYRCDDFPRVAQHELGHGFGLPHAPGGVMVDPGVVGARVNATDAAVYASHWCPR